MRFIGMSSHHHFKITKEKHTRPYSLHYLSSIKYTNACNKKISKALRKKHLQREAVVSHQQDNATTTHALAHLSRILVKVDSSDHITFSTSLYASLPVVFELY